MSKKKVTVEPDEILFYVSPRGNNRWSGKFAEPNGKGTDGPFADLAAAQRAVRKLRKGKVLERPVRVFVRGGFYALKRPLKFGAADSGYLKTGAEHLSAVVERDCTVVYAAYGDEVPVLSGGRRIMGWRETVEDGVRMWVAAIPQVRRGTWNFRQLWVNGERRYRPRLPREGFYRVGKLARERPLKGHPWCHGDDRFVFEGEDLRADWRNLRDVEVVVSNYWVDSHMWVKRVDGKKKLVVLDRPCRSNLLDDRPVNGERIGACYHVENVFEALENPGEWYLDRPTGKLYYLPMPGEDLETAEVIAPRLDQVLIVEGGTEPVEDLQFEGLTFAHTEWTFPEGLASSEQAARNVPGAVSVKNARRVRFEGCAVEHTGTYGVECLEGTLEVAVVCSRLSDLGAGGVKLWHGCRRALVADNEIGDGGRVFEAGVGVVIGQSGGNRVVHNHIHDFGYTGISAGWHWGYGEGNAFGNILEYNHIHEIGRGRLSDMGGIYMLSPSPGTRVRFNLIHDVESRTYGGWGIYTDEGSSYILIENNLAYRTTCGGFHQHYGRENLIRNNIFAFAQESQLNRTRLEPHESFTFENNIVYFTEGAVWKGRWAENRAVLRNNLYFDPGRKRLDFGGMTFRQWQARGLDEGSRIADPMFVNPAQGDFRLRKKSPAFEMGFVAFDLSTVGPRA